MNAREELALLLANVQRERNGSRPLADASQCSNVAYQDADAIIASGYRKPRTITTAEELDALAVGSVVLTATSRPEHPLVASQKYFNGGDPIWHRGGRLGGTHGDYILPATVLFEPSA